MDIAQENLRRYLLGDLEGPEADRIGVAIIAGDDLDEPLRLAEHDLMEDHLEGSLSPRETELFFENFMVSRERSAELASIRLFHERARRAKTANISSRAETANGVDGDEGSFARLSLFRRYWIGFAAAALVLAIVVFVFTYDPTRPGGGPGLAELNGRDLGDLAQFADVPKLPLTPGKFRGSRPPLTPNINANGSLMLRLILPTGWGSEYRYSTEFSNPDGKVYRVGDLAAYQIGPVHEVRILVPASLLTKGEHKASVTRPGAGGGTAEYWFDGP